MAVTQAHDAAVFLDKDGTLVRNVPYNVHPDRVQLMPGVLEGLRALQDAGFRLVVVSNQPGVALGKFRHAALAGVEACIDRLVAAAGVVITDYAWCPHHPRGSHPRYAIECRCRKPAPGLLLDAARAHGLDPARSWMIGDILDDVEAGARAGCRTVLVDRGGETEWRRGPLRTPDFVVHAFDAAARAIVDTRAREAIGDLLRPPLRASMAAGAP